MKIKQSVTETKLNEKGEIIGRARNETLTYGQEPSFVKLYLQDILYLKNLPQKHSKLLLALLKRASYAECHINEKGERIASGMEVVINSALKRRIMNDLKIKSTGSISNSLTELVKGKVLYRIDTGIYRFNPYLFGKGDWQDIRGLRMNVNYSEIKGRDFKTIVEYAKSKENKTKTEEENKPLPGQKTIDDELTPSSEDCNNESMSASAY